MTNQPLLFTPRALAQLRKLGEPYQSEARRLCERLEADPHGVSKKLAGGAGAWRARLKTSDVRVGWAPDADGSPVVFWAALKGADPTYKRVRDRAEGLPHQSSLRLATDVWIGDDLPVEVEAEGVPDVPAYRRVGGWDEWSWRAMLYGGYANSPRLVRRQEEDFHDIVWGGGAPAEECVVVRGGAGSGKSVCALLWACHLGSGKADAGAHRVVYLAPDALVDRFRAFPEVEECLPPPAEHVLTVKDWFHSLAPEAPPSDPSAVADAFNEVLRKTQWGRSRETSGARDDDVLLYEAFVLGERNAKDAAADEHAARAAELAAVSPETWLDALAERGVSSRTTLARAVRRSPLSPPTEPNALIVVDEAQDLLIEELLAVRAVWDAWNAAGCVTRLWLFGDLNQRITPSGFTWSDLNQRVGIKDAPRDLEKNYRNTAAVLRLAARVHEQGQRVARETGRRHLPPPSVAGVGTVDEEPVSAVRVRDAAEAARFVRSLHDDKSSGDDPERYLRSHLARRAQVLTPRPREDLVASGAVVYSPRTVKGSELDAAVAVDLFSAGAEGAMGLHEVNAVYTLVTRVRSRLLLVLTDNEHEWAARNGLLQEVEVREEDEAKGWVMELASAVDLAADPKRTFQRLCEPSPAGGPWLDAWEVLVESGQAHRAAEWDQATAPLWSSAELTALLDEPSPWLRAIATVRLGRLSEAEGAIVAFRQGRQPEAVTGPLVLGEADRLAESLAELYERAGRPYEAHRLRSRLRSEYTPPPSIPMPEVAPHGPLAPALTRAVAARLRALTA